MKRAEKSEHKEASRRKITQEKECCERQEKELDGLSRERIDNPTGEWSHAECGKRIAEKNQTDGVLACTIRIGKVERQERHNEHKGEIHQEIRQPYLNIIGIPKSFHIRKSAKSREGVYSEKIIFPAQNSSNPPPTLTST